jgi:hypothetical protein
MLHYDFGLIDSTGHLRTIVEAKKRLAMPASWAKEFRRNLLTHTPSLASESGFVFVTPDTIFVWRSGAANDATPDAEVDARPILAPYFERSHTSPEQIDPAAFELLVSWWLQDLVSMTTVDERLRGSGLGENLMGGEVRREVAA